MNPEIWQQLKTCFQAALELTPEERPAFLTQACDGDDDLRDRVEKLLASHDGVGSFLASPAIVDAGVITTVNEVESKSDDRIGQRIGPYEILREIGRGGMGTVFLAIRADDQYRKEVAIKIVNRGMDTDTILRRFVMERQILANLEHPNIARMLDGGTTDDGLPYFVMEHVEGETINRYCDQHRLNTLERLQLFRQVCSAVQFAHQNLIVHRDLKPSNIIVTADGTPKLLDFGIAKLLDSNLSEATATIARLLTPEYASPEQLRGMPMTTTGDVYSLGVILYELLSGHRPFNFASRLPEEVARQITAGEPLKPSVMITRLQSAHQTGGADHLSLTPEAISHTREGDLDNILLKSLRKEPERRYASVQELSTDIQRHLTGMPVLAREDTFAYRAGKFIHRNKASVAAAAVVAITLSTASVVTTWQATVARRERAKAERRFKDVRNLTNSFLFDFHDAIAELNGATNAREMVVKKAQEYLSSLAQEAGEDRELLWELSTAYLKLGDAQGRPGFSRTGDTDGALRSYEQSLEIRRHLVRLEPGSTEYQLGLAITLSRFGPIFQVLGKPALAAERMSEAMAITDKLLPQSHDVATFIGAFRNPAFLGDALAELGRYDEALAMYQKSLSIAEQMKRESFPDKDVALRFLVSRERLGFIFNTTGEYQKALDNDLEMLAKAETLCSLDPSSLDYDRGKATALDHVGDSYRGLKNYPKALENGRHGLEMYEVILQKDPQNARAKKDVGDCSHHVAETLLASGNFRAALSLLQRTVSLRRELVAHDQSNVEYPDDLANSLVLTGEGLSGSGNFSKAIEVLQEARAISEPIVASHRQRIDYRRELARLYTDLAAAHLALKNPNEAVVWYQKALDLWIELQNQNALWAKEVNMPKEVAEDISRIHAAKPARSRRGAMFRADLLRDAFRTLCANLSVLCVSAVNIFPVEVTAETQSTLRLRRESSPISLALRRKVSWLRNDSDTRSR
jgi:serine/threonine protein kinase